MIANDFKGNPSDPFGIVKNEIKLFAFSNMTSIIFSLSLKEKFNAKNKQKNI